MVLLYLCRSTADLLNRVGCTRAQAEAIANEQPFQDVADLKEKLGQGRRRTGPAGLSPNIFEDCVETLESYSAVDDVLERCERIGRDLQTIVDSWSLPGEGSEANNLTQTSEDGALSLSTLHQISAHGFLRQQPSTLSKNVTLKEYQIIGMNWLNLLFSKKRSCILADEMGE